MTTETGPSSRLDKHHFPGRLGELVANPVFHVLLILYIGFFAYSNTFHSPMLWDESYFIMGNPIIKDLSYFFDPSSARGFEQYNILKTRYVGFLTFALNYRAHGFSVEGYHFFNLFVHMANALLVYYFLLLTFRTPGMAGTGLSGLEGRISLFSALVFVAHPVQTEAVTYIYQRLASLAAFFYLFSLVLYIKGRLSGVGARAWGCHALCVVSAVLAMKTKENAFTLPLAVGLYEFVFFRGAVGGRLMRLIPLSLTMLIVPLGVIGWDRGSGGFASDAAGTAADVLDVSNLDYLYTQMRVVVTYIRLLFLPVGQNFDYDYPIYGSFFDPAVMVSFVFLSGLFLFGAYLMVRPSVRRGGEPGLRLIGFGVVWFFLALSVESTIIRIPMVINEYRVYLPSMGAIPAVVVAAYLSVARRPSLRAPVAAVMVIAALALSAASFARNSVWRSESGLWEDVVKKSPCKARPHNNLGVTYERAGRYEEAEREYAAAVRIKPDYANAYYNLGVVRERQGRHGDALDAYKSAVAMEPGNAPAHKALGFVLELMGREIEAEEAYRRAINIRPDYAEAYYNIGVLKAKLGSFDESIIAYGKAIEIDPDYAEAHNNLGLVHERKGRYGDAEIEYNEALRARPGYDKAHGNLGVLYLRRGQYAESIKEFRMAINLSPDTKEHKKNLRLAEELLEKERGK